MNEKPKFRLSTHYLVCHVWHKKKPSEMAFLVVPPFVFFSPPGFYAAFFPQGLFMVLLGKLTKKGNYS